jgi:TorA maturation chaperone TorD
MVRQAHHHDGEDHAAALFEVMAMISRSPDGLPPGEQAAFFGRHLAPWVGDFLSDLEGRAECGFYRAVGLLGRRFLQSESRYLRSASRPVDSFEGGPGHEG